MITAKELKDWLATIGDDENVFINDGDFSLLVKGQPSVYIEVGTDPNGLMVDSETHHWEQADIFGESLE